MGRSSDINALSRITETLSSDSADVYLIFVDLCDSTKYKQVLKSQSMPEPYWVVRQLLFLNRCAEIIEYHKGTVVKTIGDEIFAYFDISVNPTSILKCSIEIIQSLDNLKFYSGDSKIKSKISLDFGPTYNGAITKKAGYDPVGSPVDRCARLNSCANPNEILFSMEFNEVLITTSEHLITDTHKKYNIVRYNKELKGLGLTNYFGFSAQ